MRQLTSLDSQFLALETRRQSGHVASVAILDPSTTPSGTLTIADIEALITERLPLLPPLRWRLLEVPLGLDYPYWIDDEDFDLNFHVREIGLPAPGSDEQLAEQVARIVSRPLDRARPLWELYLVSGLQSGHVALLTKIHHAVIDGMSGAEIMGLLLDLTPEGRVVDTHGPWGDNEAVPGDLGMLLRGLAGAARYPLRALRALPSAAPNLQETQFAVIPGVATLGRLVNRAQRAVLRLDAPPAERGQLVAPKTTFSGRISAHRRFTFGQLSLDDVKAVKNAHGCTVNDVIVSICAGAVRRWLIAHDELPDTPLVAQIPISVRTEEQIGTYGNRIMLMSAPLHTEIADPVAAPARHARFARRHEDAPPRAAREPARRRQPLHPAGRLLARGAADVRTVDEPGRTAGLEPRDLQRPRPAVPAVLRGREARRELPGVGHHPRDGPEHHGDELHGPSRLRDRRRPRADARRRAADRVAPRGARAADAPAPQACEAGTAGEAQAREAEGQARAGVAGSRSRLTR